MVDKEGAERAVEALDGTFIGDRMLSVKITEDKPVAAKKPYNKFGGNFSPKPAYNRVERKEEEVRKKRPRKQF